MNDHADQSHSASRPEGNEIRRSAGLSRRGFARAGAAAPVVLGSLISKPVLAQAPYLCTLSGQMSGNLSAHPGAPNCRLLGVSPTFWKNNASWPVGTTAGSLPSASCAFSATSPAGTRFNGFSSGGSSLAIAFKYKVDNSACVVFDARQGFNGANNKATMLQVLNTAGGLNSSSIGALGRATVASLLNALSRPATYPLTPKQVIDMFNAVYKGGKFQVNATTFWSDAEVLAYFESLYS